MGFSFTAADARTLFEWCRFKSRARVEEKQDRSEMLIRLEDLQAQVGKLLAIVKALPSPLQLVPIQIDRIPPDAVIVLRSPVALSMEERHHLAMSVAHAFGPGRKIAVLEEDIGISFVAPGVIPDSLIEKI